MACNSRCWNSKSKVCSCSCGGKNHGHGLIGQEMARLDKAFPPCTPARITNSRNCKSKIGAIKGNFEWIRGEIKCTLEIDGLLFHVRADDLITDDEEIRQLDEEIPS